MKRLPTPEGWRVLGADEVIDLGDMFWLGSNPEAASGWYPCISSQGTLARHLSTIPGDVVRPLASSPHVPL